MPTVGNVAVEITASTAPFSHAMKTVSKEITQLSNQLGLMFSGMTWSAVFTKPFTDAIGGAIDASLDFEQAFAGVRKTVDATPAELQQIENSLRSMSTQMPVTAEQLAEIAQAAGQMGVRGSENISRFTDVIARLGVSTDLVGEEAAMTMARFANITQMPMEQVDRLGSAIVALGNNSAATESEIADMALRLAGAGATIGLTEQEILGISAALQSLGVNSEAGGTAFSRLFMMMANNVAKGGKDLANFAATAGMSAKEFATTFNKAPAEAITRFINGLGEMRRQGYNVYGVLDTLGIKEVRLRDAIIRTAGAGDLLNKEIALSNQAWEQNSALLAESNTFFNTTSNIIKTMKNNFAELGRVIGDQLAPFLNIAAQALTEFTQWVKGLPQPVLMFGVALFAVLAAIGPLMLGISSLGLLTRGVNITFTMFNNILNVLATTTIGAKVVPAIRAMGMALKWLTTTPWGIIVSLGILAAVVLTLTDSWGKAWSAISAIALYAASIIVRGVGIIIEGIGFLIPPLRGVGQTLVGVANNLKAAAGQAMGMVRSSNSAAGAANNLARTGQKIVDAQSDIADSAEQAAAGQDKLGDSAKKARQQLNDNIQSFDEVHQIQQETADSALDGVGATIPKVNIPEVSIPEVSVPQVGDVTGGLGEGTSSIIDTLSNAWDKLGKAMEPANKAIQWIKDNWPTIEPIMSVIATILTVILIPRWIKLGVEALLAGGKVVKSWVMQGINAVTWVAKQLIQFALLIGKWILLGAQATLNAAKVVAAWIVQGIQAVASAAQQVIQFVLLVGRWILLGVQATINAAKVVLAWIVQGAQAVASAATQVIQFILLVARWVLLGVQATINAAKVVIAWLIQQAPAIATAAVMVAQSAIIVGKWILMGVQAMANAVIMAAAWFIALGPVAWVTATIIAIAALVIANWDKIKVWTTKIWSAVSKWLSDTWEAIKKKASDVWNAIVQKATELWNGVKNAVMTPIKAVSSWLSNTWELIRLTLARVWGAIVVKATEVWNSVKNAVMTPIKAVTDWLSTTWEGVKNTLTRVWNAISSTATSVWNGIKNTITGVVNGIIRAINAMIRGLNKIHFDIPDWVPGLGGKSFGFNLNPIPLLANGGIVTKPTLAMIGEAGPEAVVPLNDIGGSPDVYEEVYQAVVDAMRTVGASQNDQAPIVLNINGREFARATLSDFQKEAKRVGVAI